MNVESGVSRDTVMHTVTNQAVHVPRLRTFYNGKLRQLFEDFELYGYVVVLVSTESLQQVHGAVGFIHILYHVILGEAMSEVVA